MATWPGTLPAPLLAGYGGEPVSAVQRTEFDAGAARQRQRFTDAPDMQSAAWRFTGAEMAIFRAFWTDDLHRGTDWFDITLDIGFGLTLLEARFVGGKFPYNALSGMNWQVNAQLDVRDPNV